MNALKSFFRRTFLPALVLALFTAAAHAQSSSFWLEAECGQVGS
jgi:hypothetical protein